MDDNPNSVTLTDDDDLNTTAPASRPDVWKMPEPVFQQTSGKLPAGYERNYSADGTPSPESATASANEPGANVSVANAAEPQPKNPTMKIVLVLLGLAAMIAFLIAFLTIIYFFFWR